MFGIFKKREKVKPVLPEYMRFRVGSPTHVPIEHVTQTQLEKFNERYPDPFKDCGGSVQLGFKRNVPKRVNQSKKPVKTLHSFGELDPFIEGGL